MVVSEEQDGKSEDDPNMARSQGQNVVSSSRHGGVEVPQQQKVCLV